MIPEDKGRIVTTFLKNFFTKYVEYDFTAELEEKLDLVSDDKLAYKVLLRDFWKDFTAAIAETKELRVTDVFNALERCPCNPPVPRQGRRQRPAHLPQVRHRPPELEAVGQIRRLHRLRTLSRVQLQPPPRQRRSRRCSSSPRRQNPRQRPRDRPRRHL